MQLHRGVLVGASLRFSAQPAMGDDIVPLAPPAARMALARGKPSGSAMPRCRGSPRFQATTVNRPNAARLPQSHAMINVRVARRGDGRASGGAGPAACAALLCALCLAQVGDVVALPSERDRFRALIAPRQGGRAGLMSRIARRPSTRPRLPRSRRCPAAAMARDTHVMNRLTGSPARRRPSRPSTPGRHATWRTSCARCTRATRPPWWWRVIW